MKHLSLTPKLGTLTLATSLVALLANTSVARADDVYSFGGSCPSQGAWTQAALAQTKSIANAISQLRANGNCMGIEKVGQNLLSAANTMAPPSEQQARESRMEAIPGESDALSKNVMVNGRPDPTIANMLLHRNLEAASIAADLNKQNSSSMPGKQDFLAKSGLGLTSFFKKYEVTTRQGLQLVTDVMRALPQYDECLMGNPVQGMAIMSGAIKIAGSLSAAGTGVGEDLGNALTGLMTMMRERKFTQALRRQDETAFWFSISCLLEGATKNYCDAQNAEEILHFSQSEYNKVVSDDRKNDPNQDKPLSGYYLLVRELPLIQTWLQKVQFGATPRLSTDATFKNNVWTEVNNLTLSTNRLIGFFNEQSLLFQELPEAGSKRNLLAKMVEQIAGEMTNQDNAKFFTTSKNATLLPFYLLGLDNVPEECTGRLGIEFGQWMRTNGKNHGFVSLFDDPDAEMKVVQSRMYSLVDSANLTASSYFRQRLVIDMPNLVNETLTGQYMTVNKALQNVFNYLVRFEVRLKKDPDLYFLLPSVRDTKVRIKLFMNSYNKLRGLGEQMALNNAHQNQPLMGDINASAKEVIDAAFLQFNMLLQKDTFLTTRLTTFIEKDFSMRVREGLNMTEHQQALMLITQKHMLEKLTEVNGLNPTSAQDDLAKAQVINKRNIDTIGKIFSDSIFRMILEIKAVATGKGTAEIQRELDKRMASETKNLRSMALVIPTTTPGGGLFTWLFAGHLVRNNNPDLYQQDFKSVSGKDDKFKEFTRVQAMFCAQTLAFENKYEFESLCKGTVVKSFYSNKAANLDLRYDDFITTKKGTYKSRDICAYNNFTIKNYVQWLKDQDSQMYSDNSIE